MTDAQRTDLDTLGYTVLENFLSDSSLNALRSRVEELFAIEGEAAGSEFKQEQQTRRLANLMDKGEVFERAMLSPEVLAGVRHVLGSEFKLSSLNVRSANPHSSWVQPLHADMGAKSDEKGYWVCNTVWMLDAFTDDNGALRVVPGSHRWGALPHDKVADLYAPYPGEVFVTAPAGTVVIMNAHLWHGGTANRTAQHRRAMHGFFCRRDKPQQQYQKQLVRADVQARFLPATRALLALDDPLNDELSAHVAQTSGFLK